MVSATDAGASSVNSGDAAAWLSSRPSRSVTGMGNNACRRVANKVDNTSSGVGGREMAAVAATVSVATIVGVLVVSTPGHEAKETE